ncbi:hypothetical protein [Bradyrhizobium liaoningense]|uniref:hypothetical protein n=1 Tax=Bradyrhizobium liaoningense TaxID=43992 RepID=UPI000558BD44|nr:hypothetical protein [Bradyrhizobium liaoningense]
MTCPEPPFTIYQLFKDFQPTLAAAIALTAAYLAYTGAMAKVRHDQDAAAREYSRTKLALFLRLRFEVRALAMLGTSMKDRAEAIFYEIRSYDAGAERKAEFLSGWKFEHFRLTPGLDEAWLHLHYFPLTTANLIDRLRRHLFLFRSDMETLFRSSSREELAKTFSDIGTIANSLLEDLDGLIATTLSASDPVP